ncbi:MAG: hypothetical protein ACXWC4_21320 [Telluria sp.]
MRRVRNALVSLCLLASVPAFAAGPWTVRFDGVGPLRFGMRFDQVNAQLGHRLARTPQALRASPNCDQLELGSLGRKGTWLLFIDDVFRRVDVQRGGATAAGIAPGLPARRVFAAYAQVDTFDTSEDAQLLTVRSPDGRHAIRFESVRGKVEDFYAGDAGAVEMSEPCL